MRLFPLFKKKNPLQYLALFNTSSTACSPRKWDMFCTAATGCGCVCLRAPHTGGVTKSQWKVLKGMQDPHGLQERENWEEPRKSTASKPWFQSVLCANIQCAWALRLERKSPKSRNCALSALSQPAPPSGGSEPAKMGLEATASREWPAGLRGPGHGPAMERKRRTRREPCKRRAPGRRQLPLRPRQGNRSGQQRAGAPSPRSPRLGAGPRPPPSRPIWYGPAGGAGPRTPFPQCSGACRRRRRCRLRYR